MTDPKMQLEHGKVAVAAAAAALTGVLVGAAGMAWLPHARLLAHGQAAVLLVTALLLAAAGWALTAWQVRSVDDGAPELDRRQVEAMDALHAAEAAAARNYAAFTELVRMFA